MAALTGLVLSKPSVGYRNYFGQSSLRNLKFSCLPFLSSPFYRDPGGSEGLTIGSTDLGRGCKTALGQMAVKEPGIRLRSDKPSKRSCRCSPLLFRFLRQPGDPYCRKRGGLSCQKSQGNFIRFSRQGAGTFCVGPCGRQRENLCHRTSGKSLTITDLAGKSPLIVSRGNYVPAPAILYPQTGA